MQLEGSFLVMTVEGKLLHLEILNVPVAESNLMSTFLFWGLFDVVIAVLTFLFLRETRDRV